MIATLILLLRTIRTICGLYVVLVGFALVLLVAESGSLPVSLPASSAILLGLMGILIAMFFGLRGLLNRIHKWKYGEVHPTLGRRKWAL